MNRDTLTSVDNLLHDYHRLADKIRRLVGNDETQAIDVLDKALMDCWGQIVELRPTETEDKKKLLEFLVDQVAESGSDGKIHKQARKAILEIALGTNGV
ncbi:MAG: hypothetical protein AAGF54_18095 [Pseudomonadota bacterium]